jgi:hypothetical protein
MDLSQKEQDISAKTDVMLGGASVDSQGIWPGQWKAQGHPDKQTILVPPASAIIVRISAGK